MRTRDQLADNLAHASARPLSADERAAMEAIAVEAIVR
jgi:hypothetical protein